MSADGGASPRATVGLPRPPWLWVYLLAYLLLGVPDAFADITSTAQSYRTLPDGPDHAAALLWLFLPVTVLPVLLLVAGAGGVLLPGLRGRWVEHRYLAAPAGGGTLQDLQAFLTVQAPGVQVRVSPLAGEYARIYPVGAREVRVMIFGSFLDLWHRDRPAAQAVLHHELAHRHQGEHLVAGLGSPFAWLVRIWGGMFLLLTALPLAVLFLDGDAMAPTLSAQVLLVATQPARLLVLPVAALWLAELGADAGAAAVAGRDNVLRALHPRGREAPAWRRAAALLDHPPIAVRRLLLRRPLPDPVTLGLWPAMILLKLAVLVATAVPAYLLIGEPASALPQVVGGDALAYLRDARPVALVCVVLLVGWPWLDGPWGHLWTRSGPRPRSPGGGGPMDRRARGRQTRGYVLAASLPALVILIASL